MGRSASFKAVFSANKASDNEAGSKTESADVAPVKVGQDELARQQASLEDDDIGDFNVVRELMATTVAAKNAAAKTRERANTIDSSYTGYTADTAPSKKDSVSCVISDLFCGALDLDNICQPGRLGGAGASQTLDTSYLQTPTSPGTSHLQTPTSRASSYLTGSNCQDGNAMPRMPNFSQQSTQSTQFSVYGDQNQLQEVTANS